LGVGQLAVDGGGEVRTRVEAQGHEEVGQGGARGEDVALGAVADAG
jgi:hypothetical protein